MIREVTHRGRTFKLHDETDHTSWVIEQLPLGWETDTYDTIDKYVNGGVFVDIGAWIGLFTIHAASVAEWVLAFEPDPVAHDMLLRNLDLNGIENVEVVNTAVWEWDGATTLFTQGELGDSMTGPTRPGVGISVETTAVSTLRSWLIDEPDLVKIDTEGSEAVILPLVRDWMVPIHLSVHLPELRVPLDYGDRKHIQLTTGSYHTVLLEP